jgi:hypothetical protein
VTHGLVELEVLEAVVLEDVVGNGLVLVDLVDELLEGGLVVVLLLQVEDDCAADQRRQDRQLVPRLLQLLPQALRLQASLLVL